jgi:hypothetical protein
VAKCPIERFQRVTLSSLNIMTGDHGPERVEERVDACGTPLFGKDAERGICKGCATGWTHQNNYPTERGKQQIAEALAKAAA